MADYQILMDFQDGNGLVDYTSFISGESFTREQVVGYEDSHEISTLTMTFKPISSGSDIFSKLVTTTQLIKVKVYKNTLPFFTGVIRPNGDYEIYEDLRPISVEVLDNTYLVDKKVPVQKLFPQGEISAVDRIKSLLADIGISSSNYDVSSVPINAKIGFLMVDEGENYKDILDNICFECGYSYYFDESGKFILKNVAPDNPYAMITIGNDKLLQPFTLSKTEQEYDGVKVIAPKVSFHPNQLIFRGIKDGGSTIPVSYGLYYPENANNVDVIQKYSVVSGAKEDKLLYASTNKVLDAVYDEDITVEKQVLSATQAQVYFKNNSIDTTRYIQKFDIRADIYKNSGEVESVVSGANPQEYKTKYISSLDTSTVDRLANILYDRQRNYNYVFEFSSKESYPVGSFYNIQVTDKYSSPILPLNSMVFVFSKTVKDGDTAIRYKAVRFSEYSNNVLPAVANTKEVANSSVEGALDTEARIADTEATVSTLNNTVNSQGAAIASQGNQITALGTQLSALEGVGDGWADFSQMVNDNATAVSDLTTRVTTAEGNITTAQTTAGNALSIANTNTTGLASVVSDVSTIETTLSDEVSKSTELKNRVDAIIDTEFPSRDLAISNINGTITTTIIPRITSTETGLSSLAGRVTTAEGTITTHATEISQNADDISAVATRVSSAEGTISSHTTSITQNATGISAVASRVTTAEGTIANQGTTISSHTTAITQNADNISSVATRVSSAEGTITTHTSQISQNAAGLSSLATRVSSAEGTITTQGSLITQNADDISAVVSRVDTAEGTITSHTTSITQNADAITAVAGRTTTAEGTISSHTTSISQNADDISAVVSRVDTAEGTITSHTTSITQNADDITAVAGRTTTAEGTISAHTTQIAQNADEISSLASRTTTVEGTISSQATLITQNADDITALATRTTNAEGTITTHTSQISQNADGLSSVVTRVGTAENLITQNATSISQNADDIELKVGAVDTNGNEVIGAKLKIGTIDSSSYIRLDADEILLSGSVKADKIDVDDLMTKELVVKNRIKTQNNNVIISSNGSITAINATLEGGTFTGSVEHPSFKTVVESAPSNPISLPSKTRWRADYLYNALSSVSIGNTWKSASGSYLGKSVNAVARISSRQRLILASKSGGSSGNLYDTRLIATITVPKGVNRFYFWFDVDHQNGGGYIYATKNKTASHYKDANFWTKSTSSYTSGTHDIYTTTRTDVAAGDVIRVYADRTALYGYNFQVHSAEYDKGTFIRTSDGAMYHFLYGGYYTDPVSITSPNSYTSAKSYVLASSVASKFTSYGSGGTYRASGTLSVDGTSRTVTNLMRDGNNITFYFTSGNPSVLTANNSDGATYGSYNVSGSVKVISQEAGIIVKSITPMVNSTSSTTAGGTDIGNGSYKIRNITGAGNISGFNSISATTVTATTVWGAVAN